MYDRSGRDTAVSTLVFTRDTVAPTISSFVSIGTSYKNVNTQVTASDAFSGLATSGTYTYYQASTNKGSTTANTYNYTGLAVGGSYTFKVTAKDKAGNISSEKTLSVTTKTLVQNFAYTGGQQTFNVPVTGTYKLEVWGAQGGLGTYGNYTSPAGGKGGYSVGTVSLSSGTTLYVNVGGAGGNATSTSYGVGGWNGGGNGCRSGGGGGGATHIATTGGVLSGLVNNRTAVLIVAGGGGGSETWSNGGSSSGGTGGGTSGGNASGASSSNGGMRRK